MSLSSTAAKPWNAALKKCVHYLVITVKEIPHPAITIAVQEMLCDVTAHTLEKRGPVCVSCLTLTVKEIPHLAIIIAVK